MVVSYSYHYSNIDSFTNNETWWFSCGFAPEVLCCLSRQPHSSFNISKEIYVAFGYMEPTSSIV